MTTNVRNVLVNIPPTTATPMGRRLSAPEPKPIAIGRMPAIVEKAVIKIGRKRTDGRQRQRQQDRDRMNEALELRRQRHVNDDDRQDEHPPDFTAGFAQT